MGLPSQLPFAGAACAAALAVGALMRVRRTLADWALAAGLTALAVEGVCLGLTGNSPFSPVKMILWRRWGLGASSLLPGAWLLFSLSYARGNSREFLARWRLGVAAAFLGPIGLAAAFWNHSVVSLQQGPGQVVERFGLGWSGIALNVLLLSGSVLILMNLERTFRASVGTMRWRIKFMLMGVGLIFVVRIYTTSQALFFRGEVPSLASLQGGALVVASLLILRSLLRVGGIDLDVYPSHSALQGSITVLLAGLYLLIVGVCAEAVAAHGRSSVFALEAFLILASLVLGVLLAQSDRLQMRLGRFISRHFQRPVYDYRTVWSRFIEGTASAPDQSELCRSLVKLVAELFQTLSVAIWLAEGRSLTLVASTFISEAGGRELAPPAEETGKILDYFQGHPEPVEIERASTDWAILLKRMHPSEFPGRENRVCLPMIAHGEIVALMVLGDRVSGVPFSIQDFEMLRCVGDHATASLANVRLFQRLQQAKELEAFQTMAAFVVHDLKNAASTFSLTLKNLPVHFEDPAFRSDALRSVSRSVEHINHVIGRLSLLRHELKLRPVESDFSEVVASAAAGLESAPDFLIQRDLSPIPKLSLDREQIAKVVTNLVLNAKEAMSGKGKVRIATRRDGCWAVLAVSDGGCGMSEEFIAHSLFRPFQSTKKNGLGIGMFQSKMIVEVHGGRIAVQSAPGGGTTFRVMLPVQPA